MKTCYVHKGRKDDTEIEVIVAKTALHKYDSPNNATQGETAIYASPHTGGRARWYVGYGGDYIPANKVDIANITPL